MKKLFAFCAVISLLILGTTFNVAAQEAPASTDTTEAVTADSTKEATEQVAQAPTAEEPVGLYKTLKIKFIEGSAFFMSFVALALVLGLAFCIERILFLNLSEVDSKKLLDQIEAKIKDNDVEGAKEICRNTRGPIASICYQGLDRLDEGVDAVEKAIISYGGVQASTLEKNLPWIALFIALSPSLGFMGTVIGMIQAFDNIQRVGDIAPTVVAGGMKVALITTVFGLLSAMCLQIFYNYLLTKIDSITSDMEDSTITLLDIIVHNQVKK